MLRNLDPGVTRSSGRGRSALARVTGFALVLLLSACAPGTDEDRAGATVPPTSSSSRSTAAGAPRDRLPSPAVFDYQIGGAYEPARGVTIVGRDRSDSPARAKYNICYVNAFQTQPGEATTWKGRNSDLVLRDGNGHPVVDEVWGEFLLDISTAPKRKRLAGIVNSWVDECARKGFDAVEPDNLDSWTRSGRGDERLLSKADAIAFSQLLTAHAHRRGLAIAQKNTSELGGAGRNKIGFDFAIAEECGFTSECSDYADVYGKQLIDVEYTDNPRSAFLKACASFAGKSSVILRDRDVATHSDAAYRYERCSNGER